MPNVNVLSGDYLSSGSYFEVLGTGLIPNLISLDSLTQPSSVSFHGRGTPVTGLQINLAFSNPEQLRKHYNSQYWTLFTGSTSSGPFLEFGGVNKNQYQSTGIIISSGAWLPSKIPNSNFFTKIKLQPLNIQQRIENLENSGSFALLPAQDVAIGLVNILATEKLHVSGNTRIDGSLRISSAISGGALNVANISVSNNITGQNLISGFILRGGAGNNIIRGPDTYGATILAGSNNLNTGTFGFLGGGYNNQLLGDSSTIAGGNTNTNCSKFGFIGGGYGNTITSIGSTITESSTIVGGNSNTARGQNTAIVGGFNNKIFSDSSVLVGGINNVLTGNFSTIVGGGYNLVTGGSLGVASEEGTCYSTIVGGENNILVGAQSFIGAGLGNFASGSSMVIAGGSYNQVAGWNSTVGGGYQNRIGITGWGAQGSVRNNFMLHTTPNPEKQWFARIGYNTIGGGTYNYAIGNSNTIGGGWENEIDGVGNVIPGGWENQISGYPQFYSAILGGTKNLVMTNYPDPTGKNGVRTYTGIWDHWKGPYAQANYILGGFQNRIINGKYNNILNGYYNLIADSDHITVEGEQNLIFNNSTGVFVKGTQNIVGTGTLNQIGNPTNGKGLSNVFIVGDNVYNTKSNVVVLHDNRVKNYEPIPQENSVYINHLNGLVLQGAGITIKDRYLPQIFEWYWSGDNPVDGPTRLNDRTRAYIDFAVRSNDGVYSINRDVLNEIKDLYGNVLTGYTFNMETNYPIDIGAGNRNFRAVVTATWPSGEFDIGGSSKALTGIGKIQPTDNITIGHTNMASMNDIIIGRNNTHAYQTGESTGNYQRRMTYTKFGPSEKDSFNIIVGGDNFISGKYNNAIGWYNRNPFNRGVNNIFGSSNKIEPHGMLSGIFAEKRTPDGTIRSVLVGYANNPDFNGTISYDSYSNIYGNENELAVGNKNFNNVFGNYNTSSRLEEAILLGNSNHASGVSNIIIGSRNQATAQSVEVLGDLNWVQDGYGTSVVGDYNLIYNLNGDQKAEGEMMLGRDNASASINKQIIIGTKNMFMACKTGTSNTFIGHSNSSKNSRITYSANNSALGNFNILDIQDSVILGNSNNAEGYNLTSLGNRNILNKQYGLALGHENINAGERSLALGINAYTYNFGQISSSSRNVLEYSSEAAAWFGIGGTAQKTSLTWDGISTGINRQEIYLNGWAYDPNRNEHFRLRGGSPGRAIIPSGRIWNGDIKITVAETGLKNFRTIQQSFTIANTGGNLLPMNMLTRSTILDSTIGSSLAGNNVGLMFSGDNINNQLAVWVTGLASRQLIWNITADFLDSWIPTKEPVNMYVPIDYTSSNPASRPVFS